MNVTDSLKFKVDFNCSRCDFVITIHSVSEIWSKIWVVELRQNKNKERKGVPYLHMGHYVLGLRPRWGISSHRFLIQCQMLGQQPRHIRFASYGRFFL
jgi:hypothetical protein